jgi:hypothetical protein
MAETTIMIFSTRQALELIENSIQAVGAVTDDQLYLLSNACDSFVKNDRIWKSFYSKLIEITERFIEKYDETSPEYPQNTLLAISKIMQFTRNHGPKDMQVKVLVIHGQIEDQRCEFSSAEESFKLALEYFGNKDEHYYFLNFSLAHLYLNRAELESANAIRGAFFMKARELLIHNIAEYGKTGAGRKDDYLDSLTLLVRTYQKQHQETEAYQIASKLHLETCIFGWLSGWQPRVPCPLCGRRRVRFQY